MENFHRYFNRIFCINLDRRPDKWVDSLEEFKKWDIVNFQRVPAYDGKGLNKNDYRIKTSEAGLILTNIDILKSSIENKFERILILEDDFYLTGEFSMIDNLISQVPVDWDLLYFGGNHNSHKGFPEPIKLSENLVKVHHTFATHAVAINGKFFKEMLDKISSVSSPLDVMLTDLQKSHNAYCFSPSVAKQRAGYSDIQMRDMDYHRWIK